MTMKRSHFFGIFASFCVAIAALAGCATLDEKQRAWIFQPSDRTWSGGAQAAEGMEEVSIDFKTNADGQPVHLNALWLAADGAATAKAADAPILLYLHGARYNVTGSAPRIRRMQELGFSVLAIDYRGFGKSTAALPSEASAAEDARAAWDWLAAKYPNRPRYIFGHSLGGPIAISLAADVTDESGTIVEGTFTSIADVVSSSPWGWVPVSLLDAAGRMVRSQPTESTGDEHFEGLSAGRYVLVWSDSFAGTGAGEPFEVERGNLNNRSRSRYARAAFGCGSMKMCW